MEGFRVSPSSVLRQSFVVLRRPSSSFAIFMSRPKHDNPTPAELEILQLLWDRGELTVRQVMLALSEQRPRAYTSVMSLLNVMYDKGLLSRRPDGRAFIYSASTPREQALGGMVSDLLGRAFGGSASALVAHLLEQANPNVEELSEIRRAIRQYQQEQKSE